MALSGAGLREITRCLSMMQRLKTGQNKTSSFPQRHRDRNDGAPRGGGWVWMWGGNPLREEHCLIVIVELRRLKIEELKKTCLPFCCGGKKVKRAVSFPHLLEDFRWIFVLRLSSPHASLRWPATEG